MHPTILSTLSLPITRRLARPLFALLLTLLLSLLLVRAQRGAGAPAAAQSEAEARPLKMGEPAERELPGGQQHAYQITLSAGQYLGVLVDQRGIDVLVRLLGPDGKLIFEFDADIRQQGQEKVSEVAEVTGSYQLIVQPKQPAAAAGRYEIRLAELRVATERERESQEARKLNGEFVRSYRAGKYDEARPLAESALAIREKALGAKHPDVAISLNCLAQLYESTGEIAKAVGFQSRASLVSEHNLALNLGTGSERQKQAYLATFAREYNRIVSLHVRTAPNDAAARDLALTTLLQRKGRALDAMTDSIAALRRRANSQDQALLDRLKGTSEQLARLALGGPQRITPAEHQRRIKALEEQKEKLEAEISARSAEFRTRAQPVTLAAVQAAIPTGAALIEFAVYRPFDATYTRADEQFGPPRYVAYVLRRQGEAQWVELGEAEAIDGAVEEWRQALRDKRRADVRQLARAADEKVLQPLRALLGKTRRVFIAPDRALNLIPFAALVDKQGHYLVRHYEFSYLTSGRDLLRLQVKQPSKRSAMVVADPAFGEAPGAEQAQERLLKYKPAAKEAAKDGTASGGSSILAEAYFPPLSGTAGEAQGLMALLPGASVLTQAQATEAALKQVSSPDILHVATHGFFLADAPIPSAERGLGLSVETPDTARIENPLLRSGLALAGANLRQSGPNQEDDGILTAQEAAGLDLWGTKMVVLSACDTGVGEVRNGEGVYGLRRALVLAGSETQVISLWPVSDKATRDLMIEYYRRLLKGEGRSAALRQVQLQMLKAKALAADDVDRLLVAKSQKEQGRILTTRSGKKPGEKKNYSHPYYWASFIQSGAWGSLEDKR